MRHHMLGDGEYRYFGQMYSHVTVAQINMVDRRTSPEQIEESRKQCMLQSRPVYIEVPVDMVSVNVLADRLNSDIQIPGAVPDPAHDMAIAYSIECTLPSHYSS